METKRICQSCGQTLAADSPQGLCPECLMKAAFGTGVAPEPGAATSQPAFTPPPIEEMAKLFPQLEIVELLGRGGMGAVYKARQPALDRWVALKVLLPQSTSRPGFAERFNREARALARLNHPGIVAVHEFGQVGDMTYFVMEYVEGVTLRRLVQERRLEPREALRIVPQICEALQFAHDEGVVHRDIKPENILLDKKGRVKIADFGIAKIVRGAEQLLTGPADTLCPSDGERAGALCEGALTQDHLLGTPQYMAPEQVEKPATVDHRADIYSLGVVFYEMLTGELPLGKFQPPSKKVQMDVRLDEVVLHALEKEPERRYQQASQVKTDVETISSTPPPSSTVDPAVAQRRHGLRVKSAILFFAAACFLVVSVSFASSGNGIAAMLSVGAMIGLGFAGYGNSRAALALDTAPGAPLSPQEIEAVRHQVKGPGTGLVVTGILNWLLIPLSLLILLPNVARSVSDMTFPPPGLVVILFALTPLVLCSYIIFGALKMKRLEAYGLAIMGSILAMMIPPGNLIGLPIGIWALVVLSHRQVRAAFGKNCPLPLAGSEAPHRNRGDGAWKVATVFVAAIMIVLAIPVGAILLLATVYYARQRATVTIYDPGRVGAAEQKLTRAVEDRLRAADYLFDSVFVNVVSAKYDQAECLIEGLQRGVKANVFEAVTGKLVVQHVGNGLWSFTGTGGLSQMKFDVDASAEMGPLQAQATDTLFRYPGAEAADSNVPAAFEVTPGFGPVFERWVNGYGAEAGRQGLNFRTTALFSISERQLTNSEMRMKWTMARNIDLLVVNKGGFKWNLVGPDLKVARLSEADWEQATPEALRRALATVEMETEDGWPFYTINDRLEKPLTFGVHSGSGVEGLLQLTGYTERPRGVKLRYKLVQETAIHASAVAATTSARFGLEKTVTLTEFKNMDGQEGLDLDTGTVFKQPKDMDQWSEEGLVQWAWENGADLFVDHGPGGVWGLLTTTGAELKLATLGNEEWDALGERELTRVLTGGGPTALQTVRKGVWKIYVPPKEAQPPMTFAFETSSGGRGVLQITGFPDNPRSVKLRCKLAQPTHP